MRHPVTGKTMDRLMAFHDGTPADWEALAFDAQAAAWNLHEHLMPEAPDRFRYELRERWESMHGARRAALRGKDLDWLREVYFQAKVRAKP
jgi:hypothetical protein